MPLRVKICGLREAAHVSAAAEAGAAYVGFVFFERSPRNVSPEAARALALEAPPGVAKVGLVVDASDEALGTILDLVPLDMLQLHGEEDPERVRAVRERFGLPVMKAVGIREAADLVRSAELEAAADQLLLDARAPAEASRPGGNGTAFDWRLLEGHAPRKPWMLAGGLTAGSLGTAIGATGARQVDVSSGVETAPGVKDEALIRAFLAEAARCP